MLRGRLFVVDVQSVDGSVCSRYAVTSLPDRRQIEL